MREFPLPIQPKKQQNRANPGQLKTKPSKTGKKQAPKPPSNGNNLSALGGWLDLSSESKSDLARPKGQGTPDSDYMVLNGQMPNLVEAFGGDDSVIMKGGGQSEVQTGPGNDVARYGSGADSQANHDSKLNGGDGHDSLFVGQEFSDQKNFHVTDTQGRTVASTGTDGHRIQVESVEEVFASKTQQGSDKNDTLSSDFKAQDTGIKLRETHTILPSQGDDKISVATGNKGQSEVNLTPGPGQNQIEFDGGATNDTVTYVSERREDANKEGGDQLDLRGGEGEDYLNILSQNYSLVDAKGEILSKLGDGSDRISAQGFEHIRINGEALKRD